MYVRAMFNEQFKNWAIMVAQTIDGVDVNVARTRKLSGFWDDGRQLTVDTERPPIVVQKPEE